MILHKLAVLDGVLNMILRQIECHTVHSGTGEYSNDGMQYVYSTLKSLNLIIKITTNRLTILPLEMIFHNADKRADYAVSYCSPSWAIAAAEAAVLKMEKAGIESVQKELLKLDRKR